MLTGDPEYVEACIRRNFENLERQVRDAKARARELAGQVSALEESLRLAVEALTDRGMTETGRLGVAEALERRHRQN
jgi:hypothetical protein